MNSTQSTKTHLLSYSEHLAHSLIQYANTHDSFASWLASVIPNTIHTHTKIAHTIRSPFCIIDERHAVERAQWLVQAVMQKRLPASNEALETLQAWKQSREETEPKAIILGLKWGVEPFGIWGEPKSRTHPMNIVVHEDTMSSSTKPSLVQDTTTLSHTLVAQSLLKARGNMQYIEPELNDWLFGEKYIHLFTAKERVLAKLLQYVKEWDIPHATRTKDERTTHIALHPILYLEDMPYASECEKIEN